MPSSGDSKLAFNKNVVLWTYHHKNRSNDPDRNDLLARVGPGIGWDVRRQ